MNRFSFVLTDEDMSTLREAVARGAVFLDTWDARSNNLDREPWYRLVNLDTLNMGSQLTCVLVQLYRARTGNQYGTWSQARGYAEGAYNGTDMEFTSRWPVKYGFDAYGGEIGYTFLRNAWIEEIAKRRESRTAC